MMRRRKPELLALIGNAPSSGSTLLADLLDASEFTASGPELGLFASSRIYNLGCKGRQPIGLSGTATLYTTGVGVYQRGLPGYGLSLEILSDLCRKAINFQEFSKIFADRYLALRGKHIKGMVFEKTPQNINCIGQFLDHTSCEPFVFLTRNPLFVHRSLRKRGYSTFQAVGTWLIAVAKFLPHNANPRVRLVRYEDLVNHPFELASEIISTASGRAVTPEGVRTRYEQNRYRELFETRVKSWRVTSETSVSNANRGEISLEEKQAVASLLSWRVAPDYARRYELAQVSLEEALVELGYGEQVVELRSIPVAKQNVGRSDRMFFFRRWGADMRRREAKLSDLPTYLRPLLPPSQHAA